MPEIIVAEFRDDQHRDVLDYIRYAIPKSQRSDFIIVRRGHTMTAQSWINGGQEP
jgi:hypothetical protein